MSVPGFRSRRASMVPGVPGALDLLLESFESSAHPRGFHGRFVGSGSSRVLQVFHGDTKVGDAPAGEDMERPHVMNSVAKTVGESGRTISTDQIAKVMDRAKGGKVKPLEFGRASPEAMARNAEYIRKRDAAGAEMKRKHARASEIAAGTRNPVLPGRGEADTRAARGAEMKRKHERAAEIAAGTRNPVERDAAAAKPERMKLGAGSKFHGADSGREIQTGDHVQATGHMSTQTGRILKGDRLKVLRNESGTLGLEDEAGNRHFLSAPAVERGAGPKARLVHVAKPTTDERRQRQADIETARRRAVEGPGAPAAKPYKPPTEAALRKADSEGLSFGATPASNHPAPTPGLPPDAVRLMRARAKVDAKAATPLKPFSKEVRSGLPQGDNQVTAAQQRKLGTVMADIHLHTQDAAYARQVLATHLARANVRKADKLSAREFSLLLKDLQAVARSGPSALESAPMTLGVLLDGRS